MFGLLILSFVYKSNLMGFVRGILVVFILSLLSISALGQDEITIIQPKKSDVLFDSTIHFGWNKFILEGSNTTYSIKVASDSNFNSIVYSKTGLLNRIDSIVVSQSGKYYWMVEVFESGVKVNNSVVNSFIYANIYQLQTLSLFLRSDTGVETSGSDVIKWLNLADTAKSAIPPATNNRPKLLSSSDLNSQNVVEFDGTDDILQINSNVALGEIYVLANWSGVSTTFPTFNGLVTGKSSFPIISGNGIGGINTNFINSSLYPTMYINSVLTRDFAPLIDFKFINAKRANSFTMPDLQFGRDRANSRYWEGGIAEVMGFSAPLSDSLSKVVNAYLCKKYSKDLSLGEDIIIPYGFCDTTISVDTSYATYSWSNGDSVYNPTLKPNSTYSLTVTDQFGCVFQDEFSIIVPINSETDQLICLNDTFIWDTKLNKSDYTFLWTDMSTDSLIRIYRPGGYSVRITDTLGCSVDLDTISVQHDSSLYGITLGPDTSICEGASIELKNPIPFINSYSWSTGDTTPSILIFVSDDYILEYADGKCIGRDTINVQIQGVAPNVNFRTQNKFLSDSIVFIDLSQAAIGDTISSWRWNFGDNNTSTLANPKHKYSMVGVYDVTLEITSNKGCVNTITKRLRIVDRSPTVRPDNLFGELSIISPIDKSILFDSLVHFHWNKSFLEDSTSNYELIVATDSLLTNRIYNRSNLLNHRDTLILQNPRRYYWKLVLYNSSQEVAASKVWRFDYTNIFQLNDLSLYLRSDTGITLDAANKVSEWKNLADTNKAVQGLSSARPSIINNIGSILLQSAVNFDGFDDFLSINSGADVGEFFVFLNWDGTQSTFPNFNGVITSQSSLFLLIANGSGGSNSTFNNNSLFPDTYINQLNTRDFSPLNTFKIVNVKRNGAGFNFSDFFIGKDRNNLNRHWDGNISEIMAFGNSLDDSTRAIVYDYFCKKYSKSLTLGEDIFLTYGFCDTLKSVDTNYISYQWSNGDTTAFSRLSPGNTYQLTVTNHLGCQYSDDISVQTLLQPERDQLLCLQDTFKWNLKLSNSLHSFRWSNGSSDSLIEIYNAGDFNVLIEDTNGCSILLDTINVQFDSSLIDFTLGPDTSICKRESIGLINGNSIITEYLWSTGNTNPIQSIDSTDEYILTIGNGSCYSSDTIMATIRGEAPLANFVADEFCFGDTVRFRDSSVPLTGDSIVAWNWSFGDGAVDSVEMPTHKYGRAVNFFVGLEVTTDKNCKADTSIRITIDPKPEANYRISNSCAGDQIRFTDQSTVSKGNIVGYNWDFGDPLSSTNTSLNQDPTHVYDTFGTYNIRLIVESDKGCLDTINRSKLINPLPDIDYRFEGKCLNDSTYFFENVSLVRGKITRYLWVVNNQQTNDLNPVVKYGDEGEKQVVLQVTTDSTCVSTLRDTITIFESPVASFDANSDCIGKDIQVIDRSTSSDSIIDYLYIFRKDSFEIMNPLIRSDSSGEFIIQQKVTTINGCIDSTDSKLTIHPNPIAAFRLQNTVAGVPFHISLENNSIGSNKYVWDFGNGDSSFIEIPVYAYTDTGSYKIKLKAISEFNCVDSANSSINVLPKLLDAAIEKVFLTEELDGSISVMVQLLNAGNNTIDDIELIADLNNEFQFRENNIATIYRGERNIFSFQSQFLQEEGQKVDFICVRINKVNNEFDDNLANNEKCEKGFNDQITLKAYPNPALEYLNLEYVLPEEGLLKIDFHDMMGREILDAIELNLKDGYYLNRINISQLKSGVYSYRFVYNGNQKEGIFIKQ